MNRIRTTKKSEGAWQKQKKRTGDIGGSKNIPG